MAANVAVCEMSSCWQWCSDVLIQRLWRRGSNRRDASTVPWNAHEFLQLQIDTKLLGCCQECFCHAASWCSRRYRYWVRSQIYSIWEVIKRQQIWDTIDSCSHSRHRITHEITAPRVHTQNRNNKMNVACQYRRRCTTGQCTWNLMWAAPSCASLGGLLRAGGKSKICSTCTSSTASFSCVPGIPAVGHFILRFRVHYGNTDPNSKLRLIPLQ